MKSIYTLFTLLLLAVGSLSAQDLTEGLVIYYPLDGDLTDSISGETAENNGNLTFADGKKGTGAVRFFNDDAYFVTPSGKLQVGPSEEGGTSGTFALYVNHRAAPLETDRQNYLAQKNGCGPTDNNRGRVVLYRQNPTNNTDPDSLISFISGRPLRTGYKLDQADTWIHLALTMNPDEREWAFYVDGLEVARDTFPGTAQAENSCGEFVVGHHLTFDNPNQTFDGLMDDLRFYNRVLTPQEIGLLAGIEVSSTREAVAASALGLSPNPVSAGQPVVLSVDHTAFRPNAPLQLRVVDMTGRTVLEGRHTNVGGPIRVEQSLPSGVYSVTLSDGALLATGRLIVR